MSGATCDSADVDREDAVMARTDSPTPRINPITLPPFLRAGEAEDIRPDERLDGFAFTDVDMDSRHLDGVSFAECRLSKVSANEADLSSANIVDTMIDHLTAPSFQAVRSRWRDVSIQDSRIGSAELYDSNWQSVQFSGSRISYLNLRGAVLQDILFTDCQIDDLDLAGARVARLAFSHTKLGSLSLTGTTLKHVDLRGAELRKITSVQGLKGAILRPSQIAELAEFLAKELGIVIRDGDE